MKVDRRRLLEVLQNLLENAAKFVVPGRPPLVEIGLRPGADRAFFVKDNGQGIDPAYRERIFNIFEKLDPKAEGTGVGTLAGQAHRGSPWRAASGRNPRASDPARPSSSRSVLSAGET